MEGIRNPAPFRKSDLFHLSAYVIAAILHLALRLPFPENDAVAFCFVVVGVAIAVAAIRFRRKYLPWVLLPFYALAPLLGTLIIGYVRFAEIYMASPPHEEPTAPMSDPQLSPLFIHVSDLHFLGARAATYEGEVPDKAVAEAIRASVIKLHPTFFFLTGDVTDTGEEIAWKTAREYLRPIAREGITIIMAPGNHDLQPAFGGGDSAVLSRRFLQVQVEIGAELRNVDQRPLQALLAWKPSDAEIEKRVSKKWADCVDACMQQAPAYSSPIACSQGCEEAMKLPAVRNQLRDELIAGHTNTACPDWFPLLYHDIETVTTVIVLCSSSQSASQLGGNAIGAFGPGQVTRFRRF